ncbi:hypothetical protein [Methyloglobulus sp.]|uniref:hypothetical protein n=1 Tax=Methyloglobulus sp. TaxID=2518622 RepID=UPI003989B625
MCDLTARRNPPFLKSPHSVDYAAPKVQTKRIDRIFARLIPPTMYTPYGLGRFHEALLA